MLPIPTIFKSRRNLSSVSELRERRFFHHQTMNYTLKELQQRVNKLIEVQGEDAHCAAWIFTAENCIVFHEDTKEYHFVAEGNPELAERILSNVSDDDHIFQEIQSLVDEVTEEQYMLYQQELAIYQQELEIYQQELTEV